MATRLGPLRPLRATALAVVLLLGVAACGGDGDDADRAESTASASPTESAEPTDDPSSSHGISDAPEPDDPCVTDAAGAGQAAGDGFAFAPPKGWQDVSDQLTAALTGGNVSGIAWADRASVDDGFADNLNVIVTADTGVDDVEQLREQFSTELSQAASDVTPGEDREVACETALYQTATTTQQGHDLVYDQVLVVRDGDTYVLTFTHTADTPAATRETVVSGTLASWKWVEDE